MPPHCCPDRRYSRMTAEYWIPSLSSSRDAHEFRDGEVARTEQLAECRLAARLRKHSIACVMPRDSTVVLELNKDVPDQHPGIIPLTECPGLRLIADDVQIVVPQQRRDHRPDGQPASFESLGDVRGIHRAAAVIDEGRIGNDLGPAGAQPFDQVRLGASSARCRSGARAPGRAHRSSRGPGRAGRPRSTPARGGMREGQAGTSSLTGSNGLWAVLNPFAKFGEAWGGGWGHGRL